MPSSAEARALTDRIKVAVEGTWLLIQEAYASRTWAALGYDTWDAYVDTEFRTARLALPKEERAETIQSLRAAGMSVRAISTATGVSVGTVHGDLSRCSEMNTSTEVQGTDGKTYSPTRPAATPKPSDDDLLGGAEFVVHDDTPAAPLEPPKPKRPPLDKTFMSARVDLERAANRLGSIANDDRFQRNRQMVHGQMTELMIAVEQVAELVEAADLPSQEDERLRHWWAERLNTIGNALTGIANNLN
jgi:hypothetical protein